MKRWVPWAVALLIVLLVVGGVLRALSARKAQQQALAAASAAQDQGLVELAATDVVKAEPREVLQGLAVSGALKAVNSAVIKARVAGELQGLTVREGDFVKAGQVIARIDASEYQSRVRQAREQAESAKAQVEVVQRQYDNNKALVDQGFISRTALDTSLANLNAAKSTYRAALAATEVAAKAVDDTVLRTPISGQVSQRLAQPGERVGVDAKIVEVVDLSRLELEATLSATDSMDVRVGQRAELQIEGSRQPVSARVVRINPSAQAGSRSVLAYLAIENTPGIGESTALPLRQGLFAQGTLGTLRAPLLAVPVSAVRTDKPAPYVQAIENDQVVHRAVEPGARGASGNEAVVAVKGIAENTLVIRGEIPTLREGTRVRFTRMPGTQAGAAANPAGSAPAIAPTPTKPAP
ncbi:MAG: efflux RND transporter periplasmic adaptor subunit [Polaromonas sp.]|uniref:efflux RND transporter periplasmic adaptor subunit n=1 Tax=Polaromonas sp. TaxID=1869339 RepID=UPI002736581C|nr:efflux RND transporter periplasmic adaptor subunit [Polaromonas sp.]MDP3798352.1 efflux RND transporter periplasmic adaptor subunit [Polaromonas sp.]